MVLYGYVGSVFVDESWTDGVTDHVWSFPRWISSLSITFCIRSCGMDTIYRGGTDERHRNMKTENEQIELRRKAYELCAAGMCHLRIDSRTA